MQTSDEQATAPIEGWSTYFPSPEAPDGRPDSQDEPRRRDDAATLAQRFHEAYERLAPSYGYETREASAKPWAEVPANNRALMTAVCAEIIDSRAETRSLIRVRDQLHLDTVAEALNLLVELWPKPATDPVQVSPDQWKRLRQVLLAIPELGDKL